MKYLCVVAVQESLFDLAAQDDPTAPIQFGQATTARLRLARGERDLDVWDPAGGRRADLTLLARLRGCSLPAFLGPRPFSLPFIANLGGGRLIVEPGTPSMGPLFRALPSSVCRLRWEPSTPADTGEVTATGHPIPSSDLILDPIVFVLDTALADEKDRLTRLLNDRELRRRALVLPPTPLPSPPSEGLDLYGESWCSLRDEFLDGLMRRIPDNLVPAGLSGLALARDPFVRDFLREGATIWFEDAGLKGRSLNVLVPTERSPINADRFRFVTEAADRTDWRGDLQARFLRSLGEGLGDGRLKFSEGEPPFSPVTILDGALFGDDPRVPDLARCTREEQARPRANRDALGRDLDLQRRRALESWRLVSPESIKLMQMCLDLTNGRLPDALGDLAIEVARSSTGSTDDRPAAGIALALFAPLLSGFRADSRYLGGRTTLTGFFGSLARLAAGDKSPSLANVLHDWFAASDRVDPDRVEWALLDEATAGGFAVVLPPHTGWLRVVALVQLLCPLSVAVRPAAAIWDDGAETWASDQIQALFGLQDEIVVHDIIGILAGP